MQLALPSLQDIQHLQSEAGAENKYSLHLSTVYYTVINFNLRSVVSVVSANTMVWHFEAFPDINLAAVNLQEDLGVILNESK